MDLEAKLESLTSQYDAKIDELTQLDDETDVDEICLDKQLMTEYESKKAEIEEEISEIEEEIEKVNEQLEESEMRKEARFMTEKERKGDDYKFCYDCNHFYGDDECNNCDYYDGEEDAESSSSEEYVSFKIESKDDCRIYLAGEVDISTIDDTDGGDWSYEQNDGTSDSHIPNYWKTFTEDLTDEFHDLLNNIDWEDFQQSLCDFTKENRTFDCGEYLLHINEGAKMECEIVEREDIADFFVEVIPLFNGEKIDIVTFITETHEVFNIWNSEDNHPFCENGHLYFEMSKDYWDDDVKEELLEDVNEELRRIYARCLTYDLGVYAKYGERIEQSLDDSYDNEWLFKLSQLTDDNLDSFLQNEGFIYDEE